jgi:hypothetical protein
MSVPGFTSIPAFTAAPPPISPTGIQNKER